MNLRRLAFLTWIGLATWTQALAAEPVVAGSVAPDPARLARGEYLTRVAGCHDCHTPGYAQRAGQVPRERWLTGDATAWQGPWGSSFASNTSHGNGSQYMIGSCTSGREQPVWGDHNRYTHASCCKQPLRWCRSCCGVEAV